MARAGSLAAAQAVSAWLAIPMGVIFLLSTALRVWTIRAMAGHWSMQIMDSTQLGSGHRRPVSLDSHPNYVAVVAGDFLPFR